MAGSMARLVEIDDPSNTAGADEVVERPAFFVLLSEAVVGVGGAEGGGQGRADPLTQPSAGAERVTISRMPAASASTVALPFLLKSLMPSSQMTAVTPEERDVALQARDDGPAGERLSRRILVPAPSPGCRRCRRSPPRLRLP